MNGDFEFGEWAVHPKLNAVVRDGASHHVSPKAVEVLVFLAENQGDVVTKEAILASVWSGTFVTDDALTRCIGELRRVFEDDAREPHIIQTIAKRGYRLVPSVRWLKNGSAGGHNGDSVAGTAPSDETTLDARDRAPRDAEEAATVGSEAAEPARAVRAAGSRRVSRRAWSRPPHSPSSLVWSQASRSCRGGARCSSAARSCPQSTWSPATSSRAGTPGPTSRRGRLSRSRAMESIVYSARREGTGERRLFLRRLGELHATPIAGTEGGYAPFLSPDD